MHNREKPSQEDVEQFLKNFKTCWDGKVVPRADSKNDDTLTILGITPKHRAEEVKRLRYVDYFRGPSPDHDGDPSKEWWEFGLWVKGHEIYIKIRIYKKENGKYGAIDSCITNDLFFVTPACRESFPQKDSGRAGMTGRRTFLLHLSINVCRFILRKKR